MVEHGEQMKAIGAREGYKKGYGHGVLFICALMAAIELLKYLT